MSKLGVVEELHKPARKNFPRKRTIIKHRDDLWQADLAEFTQHSKENRGHKYILTVIDCYSKFLWTRPLKSKNASDVCKAMDSILNEGRIPANLQTDQGKEFYNQSFEKLMKTRSINHYSTYSVKKAAIVERVIRTFKNALYKRFSLRGKYKWIDLLSEVTLEYNNTRHSKTKMKPKDVTTETYLPMFHNIKLMGPVKFKVGDFVRISKHKSVFAKGYTPNYSTELFKVVKVKIGNPVTYLLEDLLGKPIMGQFYSEELQKTAHPDVFLIEKILRRKGNQLYVRWLGLDKSHDSWINKSDFV